MGKGQELLDAAREGDRKTVEKILGQITKRSGPFTSLRRGAGVNVQDDNGYTPLHHACLRGHKEIVRLLLSVDASPCIVDRKGATALHLAAWKGDSDVVAMLLGHNSPPVNIDQLTSDQETALLIAAQFGNVNVVSQLLHRGADVTVRNIKEESALDLAAQYGRLETVMHLLRARPQLVDPYRFPVCRGRLFSSTPLHRASKNGHKDVVATLISAGIDPNVRTYSGTALHEAANYGKASVVRILLAKGADLNAADRRGKTVNDLLNEYSVEATKRVRRIIQEHMASNYESEEDLPPFPVQDYSPTGYPGAPGMKAPETQNNLNTNKGLSSSSSFLTKNHPHFVKKLKTLSNWANMGIKSKFSSAPNISNNTSEPDVTVAAKASKKSNSGTLHIGNSKFFKPVKFLSKKTEEYGEMVCNDEFDTISLGRIDTLERNTPVNRSNRSCPGFKTSLPNISENIELSNSEDSIHDMVIVEADSENNNKTDSKKKPTEAINLRAKLSIFEPRDTNSIDKTRMSTVSVESVVNVNYEPYVFDESKKDIVIEPVDTKPTPPPRPTVARKTSNEGVIYENVILPNVVSTPKPAVRKHIAPKIEEKRIVYENILPQLEPRQKPDPPKRTILPTKAVASVETVESSPSQSRTSTLSSGSMTDEANFEDILLSKKSRSFKHRTNFSAHSTVEKSRSRKSSQSSDDSEASAMDNVDVSAEVNEKSMYLSMTGTLPSKKPVKEVKKKVLFRHKTFTNIEVDGKSNNNEFRRNNEFIKDTLANYHIRGTGHCIYKAPTVQEFIYIFNRETLYSDVAPFEKVPNKRESYFETAICFCKPRPPKFHKSAEDLLSISKDEEDVTIDLEALRKTAEMQATSFQCFCDSNTCKYHAKNRESPSNLVVKFSAIKKSISTPNITLNPSPNLTANKTGLTKNKSVPILEEPYAVVDIVPKNQSDKCNSDVQVSNAYHTMSPPSTLSTSSRPYSIKDITDVISLKTSPSNASDVAQKYIRRSTSEHSGHWSLHTCDSNVTIKSDMSFKSCLEDVDTSDDETLSEDDISDTDTVKSERRKPWTHSDSFKFTNTEPLIGAIPEESVESGIETSEELSPDGTNVHDSNSEETSFDYQQVNPDVDSDSLNLDSKTPLVDAEAISESNVPPVVANPLASLERGMWGVNVRSGSGRRRWDEGEGTSEGDALSVSSAASSCAPHHLAHHHDFSKVSPTPPKKPPRRNLSVSPTHANSPSSGYSYELRSHARSQDDLDEIQGAKQYLKHGRSVDQYVDGKLSYSEYEENHNSPRVAPVPNPRPSLKNRSQPVAITVKYENFPVKALNPRRKLKRNPELENYEPKMTDNRSRKYSAQERSSLESLLDDSQSMNSPSDYERNCDEGRGDVPLSPTHYEQPPTPDHPPPSAKQAENSIHERIRPLSQEYKRRSALRDSYTETETSLLRAASAASVASGATDRSGTDCVEEYVCDVPFAGLFKGSTTTLDGIGLRPVPAERPKTLRKLKSVYDSSPTDPPGANNPNTTSNGQLQERLNVNGEEEVRRRSNTLSQSGDKSLSILSPFDEQEEWAKISEIMASFGSKLVRESVFVSEIEQEFTSRLGLSCSESSLSPSVASTLGLWLSGLGLTDYEALFIESGFDDVDFVNGVLEESDLQEMGIEEADRLKILESTKQLPLKIAEISNNHNNNSISCKNHHSASVDDWLKDINLEIYTDTFRKHLYVDMDRVRRIWEVELTAVLEIQKAGHRKRILASVSGQQNGPANNHHMADISADLNTLKNNLQQLKDEIKEKLPENLKAVPPPVVPTLAPPGGETLKRSKKNRPAPQPPRPSDLEIRNPSELLVGVPGALKTQWKHQPFVLVTGAVTYVANYLGSTVVKELRGTESTKKSIQKLKKSTKEPRDSPDIILSISYRGVKFLNTITRELICEHEIRNIHCACQDADDLTHFAYITKDHATKSHYCHVFCVATMDQATEVILTLGEAFEVAYQMALREQANRRNIPVQPKTPTYDKDKLNLNHGRSHSVTEIKLNGHQLKIAPIPASLSNEDFQATRGLDGSRSPRTPLLKAPIASTEEL